MLNHDRGRRKAPASPGQAGDYSGKAIFCSVLN